MMRQTPLGGASPIRWAHIVLGGVILALMALPMVLSYCSKSHAADLFTPDRPQGFAGVGHAENHAHYEGLRNPSGMSCCNGRDCRPTVARNVGGHWEVKVDGIWRSDFTGGQVLSDAWIRLEQARLGQLVEGRWNTEAHVCASIAVHPVIYCVILSDEWN